MIKNLTIIFVLIKQFPREYNQRPIYKTVKYPRMSARPATEVCGICLERLSYNRRNIHETPCGHKFHACCFRHIKEPTCPYCRREVDHEPVRKIQLLKQDLFNIKYEEKHSVLQNINYIDLEVCENRIRHLQNLLFQEMQERDRMKSVIRNTKLYYKYKKQEINNRIKCVRVDLKLNAAIKRHMKEERREEREARKTENNSAIITSEPENEDHIEENDIFDMVDDLMNESIITGEIPKQDLEDAQFDDLDIGFSPEYHGIFAANL